ncbi:MAG: hypothetical protein LBO69_01760 [Ignavibacteria bacterium]|jgi:F-type H+-transporting ATPase subunit epsilon|nr:hypothetical protein [Ignavibacteria bacterium]
MNDTNKLYALTILTPNDAFLTASVKSVTIPSVSGAFQVLVNHAPIIAAIDSGTLTTVDEQDKTCQYTVKNGIAEFKNNQLTISVASAIAN